MNICVIQARMGSSRLPGKVLRPIAGKPILQHVVERLSPSKHIDKLLVATTTNEEDLAIAHFCEKHGIPCYRGSDWDVLDRFVQAAKTAGAKEGDNIIRICCDNPIHSYKVVDFVVDEFLKLGVDYFSNSNQEPNYLEDGFDTEITTYQALLKASQEAELLSEREHVMPYIKNCGHFKLGWRKANPEYLFKLSVDTENDFKAAETIFLKLQDDPEFSIDEVVNLLKEQPQILELNSESTINSGYTKSLQTDRKIK